MIEMRQEVGAREIRAFGLLWLLFLAGVGAVAAWRPAGLLGAAAILGLAWAVSLALNPLPRRKQLLGLAIPATFALLGGAVRGGVPAWGVAGASAAVGLGGAALIWAAPAIGRGLYRGWMQAALPAGWTLSHLVLGAVYYLVLTPVGLGLRLSGYDPMRRKFEPEAETYWVERPASDRRDRVFRQF